MDILGKQAVNYGSLSADELEEILTSNSYSTKGTLSNEESILDRTLTSNNGKYQILVSEIYNGQLTEENKKENNENVLTIAQLQENASTYFGYDVINYTETLPINLKDTKWQLFYAGALDGESEERIYLISKEYVKNTLLPAKNRVTPISIEGSDYKAKFGNSTGNDGIIPKYAGSSNVTTRMRKYNNDYFKDYTSTNGNMKAVAYMLDTSIWSSFANSSEGYAEWAIGGPTVELLFTAYNKYKGLTGNTRYVADAVSERGYKISKDGGTNYENYYLEMIENDTSTVDSPYSVSNLTSQADAYWLSSPSNSYMNDVMRVFKNGLVANLNYYYKEGCGFRPLVLLNSNFQLEKTIIEEKEVFKIIPKAS